MFLAVAWVLVLVLALALARRRLSPRRAVGGGGGGKPTTNTCTHKGHDRVRMRTVQSGARFFSIRSKGKQMEPFVHASQRPQDALRLRPPVKELAEPQENHDLKRDLAHQAAALFEILIQALV